MEQHGVRKAYKYQLLPTPAQEQALATVLWRCRELYNAGLHERTAAWERCGISVSLALQSAQLPGSKDVRPDYRDSNAQVLQDVLHRLDKAFAACLRRVQAGEQPGLPRVQFQGRNRSSSCTSPPVGAHGGAVLDGGLLSRATIGRLRVRLQRSLQGTPKTVPISRAADGWYACLSCADVPTEPLPRTGCKTGSAVGLQVVLVRADGEPVDNPQHCRRAERQRRRAQRRVSRRTKGSTRRRTAVQARAKQHQQVQRQRRDVHHTTALALVRAYDTVSLEDLQVRNMVRRPHALPEGNGGYLKNGAGRTAGLNTLISDAGWTAFRQILACTAAWAGKPVEAIPPAYTSQECSGCGERVEKRLSVRTQVCPCCGLVLDRDDNAVVTMLRAGQARQARTWPVGACVA
jgi:putative transposase